MKAKCLAALAFSLVLPTAALAADDQLVAAAQKEGKVVWYTTLIVDQLVRPMVEAFEEKYPGIEVEFSRSQISEIALKLVNESQAGQPQADLFDGQAGIFRAMPLELLKPIELPNAEDYPAEYGHPDHIYHALNRYFVTAVVNTEMVPEGERPQTYEDLLDPRWKGQIAWKTDPTESGAPGFVGMILEVMGEEAGMEYLRALAEQDIVKVPASARVVLDQVIAGEHPIALLVHANHIDLSKERGAPIEELRLEPLIATVNYAALVEDSPHPNAGQLFYEFIMSREGQQIFSEANYFPSNPKVPAGNPNLTPEGGNYEVVLNSAQLTLDHLDEWVRIYNELF